MQQVLASDYNAGADFGHLFVCFDSLQLEFVGYNPLSYVCCFWSFVPHCSAQYFCGIFDGLPPVFSGEGNIS